MLSCIGFTSFVQSEGDNMKFLSEEKELALILRWNCTKISDEDYESSGLDCAACKAKAIYDAGWRKQVEAKWIPVKKLVPDWGANIIHHYECSNCQTLEYTNDRKYCSNCGAKMEK